jgi:hypothetical protein
MLISWMLKSPAKVRDSDVSGILELGVYGLQVAGNRLPVTSYWILDTGCWMLVERG